MITVVFTVIKRWIFDGLVYAPPSRWLTCGVVLSLASTSFVLRVYRPSPRRILPAAAKAVTKRPSSLRPRFHLSPTTPTSTEVRRNRRLLTHHHSHCRRASRRPPPPRRRSTGRLAARIKITFLPLKPTTISRPRWTRSSVPSAAFPLCGTRPPTWTAEAPGFCPSRWNRRTTASPPWPPSFLSCRAGRKALTTTTLALVIVTRHPIVFVSALRSSCCAFSTRCSCLRRPGRAVFSFHADVHLTRPHDQKMDPVKRSMTWAL